MFEHASIRWGLATIACLGAILTGTHVVHAETFSPFERLHQLDELADYHRREAERIRALLEQMSTRSGEALEASSRTLTRSVRRRLRTRLATSRIQWDRAHRHVRRHRLQWRPGTSSDLRHLLQIAERQHLASQQRHVRTLRRLEGGSMRRAVRVGNQARLTVQLAQHEATERTAREHGEAVVERAKRRKGATRRAIEEAAEALERTLEQMPSPGAGDFHRRKGALVPPVSASPAQGFGRRKQDVYLSYVRHTGLTYRVDPGTEVQAVASGEVVYAERFEGYGRVVIVAHGRRYHTLYAHLQTSSVEPGTEVGRGETIGESGASGSLDGPKLYFELRRDGEPVDPESWFVRQGE